MSSTGVRRWENRRQGGRSVEDESRETYYGLPVIHKPHWKWEIVVYFFLGGIAGASYLIATIARLVGGREGRQIARLGHYLSLAALLPGPLLLIMDLKRPERFYNMLRVVKLRSPMSVGTWLLTIFSGFSALSALVQAAEDGLLGRLGLVRSLALALPARPLGVAGSVVAGLFSGYTGVLLAATAVPLWAKNYLLMGPLFVASAMSNATAALSLIAALRGRTSPEALERLEKLDIIVITAELGLMAASHQVLGPVIGRPLKEGTFAPVYKVGVIGAGLILPLLWQIKSLLAGGRPSRLETGLSASLTLVGGLLYRYVMIKAGQESADDPAATFAFTRADERAWGQGAPSH